MSSGVSQLYKSVIDDVINNVREVFLDESLDEHILQELKQCWENKLMQTKAVPPEGAHEERIVPAPFTIQTQSPQTTSAGGTQMAVKTTRGIQYKYTTALPQQLPAGSIVQPTLQYQYAPGDLADGSKTVTITLPQTVAGSQKPVTISLPATALMQQGGGIVMVKSTSAAAAAQALPHGITTGILPQGITTINAASLIAHPNSDGTVQYQAVSAEQLAKQGYTLNVSQAPGSQTTSQVQQVQLANNSGIIQLDGANDTSDDDDEDEFKDDDDIDNDDDLNDEENDGLGEEEEPLNSGDDVSDEDPSELFDTDNVIVCQYDKITRSRNKWKFHLKDGIMNLQGKDFVFQRASGDAEW